MASETPPFEEPEQPQGFTDALRSMVRGNMSISIIDRISDELATGTEHININSVGGEAELFVSALTIFAQSNLIKRLDDVLVIFHREANFQRSNNNHDIAKMIFNAILVLNPFDYNVRTALAEYAIAEGEMHIAYETMKHSAERSPEISQWKLYSELSYSAEDFKSAILFGRRYLAVRPFDSDIRILVDDAVFTLGLARLEDLSSNRDRRSQGDLNYDDYIEALSICARRGRWDVVHPELERALWRFGETSLGPLSDIFLRLRQGEDATDEILGMIEASPSIEVLDFFEAAVSNFPALVARGATTKLAIAFERHAAGVLAAVDRGGRLFHLRQLAKVVAKPALVCLFSPKRALTLVDVLSRSDRPSLGVQRSLVRSICKHIREIDLQKAIEVYETIQSACTRALPNAHTESSRDQFSGSLFQFEDNNSYFDAISSLSSALSSIYANLFGHHEIQIPDSTISIVKRPIDSRYINDGIVYFITWSSEISTLCRMIATLYHPNNYFVISIGGRSSRQDADRLVPLMIFENVFILNGAPVAWGGRKLLFENVFDGIRLLRELSGDVRWMQILCNQSFPLMSQQDIIEILNDTKRVATAPPTPTYKDPYYEILPPEFTDIHNIVHNAFRRCDSVGLHYSNLGHFSGHHQAFNFNDKSTPIEQSESRRDGIYKLKANSVDMRDMGFGRYVEITDSIEDGATYSSLVAPQHAASIHAVLRKYRIYTGHPFTMIDRKFADFLIADPAAHELYLAMANQFGPEMNFFDTARMNSPHAASERFELYRSKDPFGLLSDEDIEQAAYSGRFFTRKVTRERGVEFATFFTDLIDAQRLESDRVWSLSVTGSLHAIKPRDFSSTFTWMTKNYWTLRDFNNCVLARFAPQSDGHLIDETMKCLGTWRWNADGLEISFLAEPEVLHRYERLSCSEGKMILVPSAVVSVRTDWGRFLEQSLSDALMPANETIAASLTSRQAIETDCLVRSARSWVSTVMDILSDVPEDPMLSDVDRMAGRCDRLITHDGTIMGLLRMGVHAFWASLVRVIIMTDKSIMIFGSIEQKQFVESGALGSDVNIELQRSDFSVSDWEVRSRRFPQWQRVMFADDGTILEIGGIVSQGRWVINRGRILLYDMGPWALCEFSQFTWTAERWILVGYGQYDLAEDDYMHIRQVVSSSLG